MEYLLLIFPFGSALASRLTRRWEAWAVWGWFTIFSFFGIYFLTDKYHFLPVIIVSFFGFVAPDLWESLKALLRKPKVAGIILTVIVIIFLLQYPEILINLLVLGFVVGGLLTILKPIISPKKKK